jgi:hypothetical protein
MHSRYFCLIFTEPDKWIADAKNTKNNEITDGCPVQLWMDEGVMLYIGKFAFFSFFSIMDPLIVVQ